MRAAFGHAFTSDTAATISNLHFHPIAPTAPTAAAGPAAPPGNSITAVPTTGTMVDPNGGRGIIKIDGGRTIDIKSFEMGNEEDVLSIAPEGPKWDVLKEAWFILFIRFIRSFVLRVGLSSIHWG